MKKFIFILCGLFAFHFGQAQVKFGVRVGASTASLDAKDLVIFNQASLDSFLVKADNASVGFRIGAWSRIKLGPIYLQPEVLLRTSGVEYSFSDVTSPQNLQFREEGFLNIDIPLIAGIKLGPIRAQAGPVASILLSSNSDFVDVDNYTRAFNDAEWGFQAGIGFDILKKLAIDLNYQFNLSESEDGINVGGTGYELSSETGYLVFGVAYIFN